MTELSGVWAYTPYFSRLTDHDTFARLATVETQRRGTETAGVVCAVGDGAPWIQDFIDWHRPDAVRILDWPHALGYAARVGAAVYGTDTPAARAWLARQWRALLEEDDGPAVVLTDLRRLRTELEPVATGDQAAPVATGDQAALVWTVTPEGAAGRVTIPLTGVLGQEAAQRALDVVGDSLTYLEPRAAQLCYAAFRAAGYPIGSGSVESANKLLVEARLKGAGMHCIGNARTSIRWWRCARWPTATAGPRRGRTSRPSSGTRPASPAPIGGLPAHRWPKPKPKLTCQKRRPCPCA